MQPEVTGLSPKFGSEAGGTSLTIRGDNLGTSATDVIGLSVCGVDCLSTLEWVSPNKLLCKTAPGKGSGAVVVVTRSGGRGACTVKFTYERHEIEIPPSMRQSNVWVDDADEPMGILSQRKAIVADAPAKHAADAEIDPLGIKSGVTRKPLDPTTAPKEVRELCAKGSGDPLAKDFIPALFLLEMHKTTELGDLRSGLDNLRELIETRTNAQNQLLKRNFDSVIACQQTLDDTRDLLRDSERSFKGPITATLENLLQESALFADGIFSSLLERKSRTDSIRSALSVIQRHKFLFNLPRSIETNVERGDYDVAIQDYRRAKSLFADTTVGVFQTVLEEVERIVRRLRERLSRRLELPLPIDELEKIIAYLVDLDAESDPGWMCIERQYAMLSATLESCAGQYSALFSGGDEDVDGNGSHTVAGESGIAIRVPALTRTHTHSSASASSVSAAPVPDLNAAAVPGYDQLRRARGSVVAGQVLRPVQFVRALSNILTSALPSLWKLGQSYFGGKLRKAPSGAVTASDKHVEASPDTMRRSTVLAMQHSGHVPSVSVHGPAAVQQSAAQHEFHLHTRADISKMVGALIETYGTLVRVACDIKDQPPGHIPPADDIDDASHRLPLCAREVADTMDCLSALHLPAAQLDSLADLLGDVNTHTISVVSAVAVRDVRKLRNAEDWQVERCASGGAACTRLVAALERRVLNAMAVISGVLHPHGPPLAGADHADRTADALASLCGVSLLGMLQAFGDALEYLALDYDGSAPLPGGADFVKDDGSGPRRAVAVPTKQRRLLIVLGNVARCKGTLVPHVSARASATISPRAAEMLTPFVSRLDKLDVRIFNSYCDGKSDALRELVEDGVCKAAGDWLRAAAPTRVRPYVKECVLQLVLIDGEVHDSNAPSLARIFRRLAGDLAASIKDAFSALVMSGTKLDTNAFLQATMEVKALQLILQKFESADVIAEFESVLSVIAQARKTQSYANMQAIEGPLDRFKTEMRFQLECLR